MEKNIENIIFSRFVEQEIPFEFITIKELYKRCAASAYDLSNAHRIKFHAMIIVTNGIGKHTIDFKEEILSPGVILPLTKDQIHSFQKDRNVEGYIVSFKESFITQNISEKNLFHFLHVFHTPSILIGEENLTAIHPYLELLEKLHADSNNVMKAETINAVVMALLFQIKRLSIYQHTTFESKRFKDFIEFKQLITLHYHKSHNAKDYAAMLSISYKYLNDICKQITQKTAKSFLDNWLLLEAKRNISENKYTSQEIAFKMGFNEPSNFIRFFKKFTGHTPRQFSLSIKKT